MVDEDLAPQVIEQVVDFASEIQELKDGLMEIAREVGMLKAKFDKIDLKLKVHTETPDAHHPAMVRKDVN